MDFHCHNCGYSQQINLPMEVSAFCRLVDALTKEHKECEKTHVCGAGCPGEGKPL